MYEVYPNPIIIELEVAFWSLFAIFSWAGLTLTWHESSMS